MRTPLTPIEGATGTLLPAQSVSLEDRQELLTIVDEEADKLNRLIGQVVETAQIETQEVHMNFSVAILSQIVENATKSCAWVASTHPLKIQVHRCLRSTPIQR